VVNAVGCPLSCELPEGVTEVPPPRHDWNDILRCPNGTEEGLNAPCGRAFLVKEQACEH
jgi:hypothetical protein